MARRIVIYLVSLAVVVLTSSVGWLWFGPSGTGEYRLSPDGRFTAHAMNMSTGTLTGDREWSIEVRVIEEGSGREVWKVAHRHPSGAVVPDYGNRAEKFITWAEDSSTVTVPIVGGQKLVLPVP